MPQDPTTALAALLRETSIEDPEEILKAANAALRNDKNDELAQHTRIVALLKLDRFDDASRAISEGGIKLESTCALEKAYALYKLGKLDEALTILASTGLHKRGLSHIAAQVAYRAEKFDESQSIYNRLLGAETNEEDHDLKINMQAAQAQAEWNGIATLHGVECQKASESFELCYNSACANIARGSLSIASKLLQRALTLCDASDELSQEEKEEERKPILAQQAFVFAKLGDIDRAREIHDSLRLETSSDPDLSIISQNNFLAMGKMPQNPFLLERQVAAWRSSSTTEAKLFKFQSDVLAQNSSIVSLWAHKTGGVKTRAYRTVDQAESPTNSPELNNMSVIGAAAETQGLPEKDVLKNLISLSKRRPYDTGLTLVLIQMHLQRRNPGAALYTLELFFSRLEGSDNEQCHRVRFSPGLVALAVVLKKTQKRHNSAKAELIKAAEYWHHRPASSAFSLLKEAGVELVLSSSKDDIRLAGAIFKKLNEEKLASPVTSAGLVAALAAANAFEVEQHTTLLPPVESLVHGIKVDELINSGILVSPRSSTSKKRPFTNDTNVERATKKRRRRMPKNLVDGQAPDPERWLPLRDRSSYRPKGKKGRKKAADSTQGGLVKEEETIGLVGGGGVKIEKAAASNAAKKKKKAKK